MANLSVHGVKMVMPNLLKTLEETQWRTRVAAIQLLGAMAYCAPKQLSQCLPQIVPALIECFSDTHPNVQKSVKHALTSVGSVIKSPEISALVPSLLAALEDPNRKTTPALDTLMHTAFVNCVDSPSLALIIPILRRGLKDTNMDVKRKTAQIVGSMCSLITNPKDVLPYLPNLLPPLKEVLVDPIPEVRSVAAKAMGTLIAGLGEANFSELVPWLMETMQNSKAQVERTGAAQGLAEVLLSLGPDRLEALIPKIVVNIQSSNPNVREGHFALLMHLPTAFGSAFSPFISATLPEIVNGLADEVDTVREAAFMAGRVTVNLFAFTDLEAILPVLQQGLFHGSWRVRQSTVQLLGILLFRIVGATGKVQLSGNDDDCISTEAQNNTIIRTLGKGRRDDVLASLFVLRSDLHTSVRNESLHVWKTIVVNTPRTLVDILPALTSILIKALACSDEEQRQVAGQALGDVVRRLGDRVLPTIMPILEEGLANGNTETRQGVCLGLSELIKAATRVQVQNYLHVILPAVRTALCDPEQLVQEAAAESFLSLSVSAGSKVIDDVVPALLSNLNNPDTNSSALLGLREILRRRSTAVFPYLLPKLLARPVTEVCAHALGYLAKAAEPPLNKNLDRILPVLVEASSRAEKVGDDQLNQALLQSMRSVVSAISTPGIHLLIQELYAHLDSEDTYVRRMGAMMVEALCNDSAADWSNQLSTLMEKLFLCLADDSTQLQAAAVSALNALIATINKDSMPLYVANVREGLDAARAVVQRRRHQEKDVTVPGLSAPKALDAVLLILVQSLIASGNTETRQAAAAAIGDLVVLTDVSALRSAVLKMTGPLIRIFGERCTWQVKATILQSLTMLLEKVGVQLKPFFPQLQPTFLKALKDSTQLVRDRAVEALRKLAALLPRLEPLLNDLQVESEVNPEAGVRASALQAIQLILPEVAPRLAPGYLSEIIAKFAQALGSSSEDLREETARVVGTACALVTEVQPLKDVVSAHIARTAPAAWQARHSQALAMFELTRHITSAQLLSEITPTLVPCINAYLADDKVPVMTAGVQIVGALVSHISPNESNAVIEGALANLVPALVPLLSNESPELRTAVLNATKAIGKSAHKAIRPHLTLIVPQVLNSAKDRNIAIKLAGERCLMHCLKLSKGTSAVLTSYLADCGDTEHSKSLGDYAKRVLSRLAEDSDADDE
eukprot:c14796_g1_i1.p1 GENE.c14796_g1_i1~~c14796_g1_i1.p1  ORF type:complete len:1325 (+),score=363.83 c14796_g1_i1:394-3975(+)